MNDIEQNVIAWILSTVLGSGIVLSVAWWALRGRLSEVFQTRAAADRRKAAHDEDIAGLRGHVDAEFRKVDRTMEGLDKRVQDNNARSGRAEGRTEVLAERVDGQSARLGDVHSAWEKMDLRMERLAENQAGMTEALKGVAHSLDQLRDEVRGRQ